MFVLCLPWWSFSFHHGAIPQSSAVESRSGKLTVIKNRSYNKQTLEQFQIPTDDGNERKKQKINQEERQSNWLTPSVSLSELLLKSAQAWLRYNF